MATSYSANNGQNEEYTFDAFEDGSSKLVGEQQLTKLNQFAVDYAQQIWKIEEALDETLNEVWDINIDPVSIYNKPHEQLDLIELVKTDHKIFNKVILVFSSICNQTRILKETAESKFYSPLTVFGEITGESSEGDVQIEVGKLLPFMIDLSAFVNRCYSLIRNIISQFASIYQSQKNIHTQFFKNVHLQAVYYSMIDIFSVLINLDSIITQNTALDSSWGRYLRMVKSVKQEPNKYSVSGEEDKLWQLEKLLLSLKGQLLEGFIFQSCIQQEFDFPGVIDVKGNKVLKAEFQYNVKVLWSMFGTKIMDSSELNLRERFPGFMGLYAFYIALFKDITDKSFFKQVWEVTKRVPMVSINVNVFWFPADFIQQLMPGMIKIVGSTFNHMEIRRDYLRNVDKEFSGRVKSYYLQVSRWMVRMESSQTRGGTLWDVSLSKVGQIIQGVQLSYHISHLLKTMIGLHMHLTAPLKSSDVRKLFQCAEMLKSIENTFHRRSAMISAHISMMVQQLTDIINEKLNVVRSKYAGRSNYSEIELDVIVALSLCSDLLCGVATNERITVVRLCLNVIYQSNILKENDIEELRLHIKRLEFISDIGKIVKASCDCSILFWSRDLFPTYLQFLYQNPSQATSLQYTLTGLKDVVSVLDKAIHVDNAKQRLIDVYRNEMEEMIDKNIIQPLGKDVETDLRLHIHAFLNIEEKDPFKTGIKEFGKFLELKPLRFFDRTIDIKSRISHYLDQTFYNLNTVALFDWKTYSEMRNMAFYKYGLQLLEVHLPGSTLEQGLDVLEIMRNIHIFVSRYNYNLNNQIFIQRSSNSKTLNTINITHISNSIRTHGSGIMNTTINFAYRFLVQKFSIFSEFLFDDQIKSKLYKNIKYFRENKEQLNNMYPSELVTELERDIRQLGVSETGLTFLDHFRLLITHIGNAMGYIRLVRSGGLHYCSNAIKFVPDLKKIPKFQDLTSKDALSPETIQASTNLDSIIHNLSNNLSEGTEYFKMLVNVFATEFRNIANQHLKNFYIIVPALASNYIDHMINSKDKLFKKSKAIGAEALLFTDDGFAIGLAYILKLLDQNKDFDSLHWFDRIQLKCETDQKRMLAEANAKGIKEDQNHLAIKKIQNFQQEYELFKYSFSGSRIFFKD
ncbi:hypothetical protein DDB_G0283355 [Dictyostelium discoideum AX4]|uniref:WASH complex subunit 4 n=1 Tax=Dictyostelium discoideum TaxID=44689 RepID=WASC4_DICDI|nr:hypothetical protein DDB_G0283355 [Dictyostelium discoideum AX4]Q54R74.1 RecName: Full=WASH complex subunit 4; AltName: Full=WASH complex subunit SWIP homolog [Dictyostelium discoideum]EAL65754.1 hypothetical protein DDB_G0283355 [Dictyostelium discoideum AX4]|eukprot:XP_639109.1 hypothetical protein DDB_G0283355 [Dictyostelium discoideum AX4]